MCCDMKTCILEGNANNRPNYDVTSTGTINAAAIRVVLLSVGIHTDKCVISGLLSVWIRTAVCASIYTIHTLALTVLGRYLLAVPSMRAILTITFMLRL